MRKVDPADQGRFHFFPLVKKMKAADSFWARFTVSNVNTGRVKSDAVNKIFAGNSGIPYHTWRFTTHYAKPLIMEFGSTHVIHRIGAKIRSLRKNRELRLAQLAEAANMSTALLSKIENGRIIPTIPKLLDLIRVLEIEPQDFFAEINGDEQFSGYILLRKENYTGYVKEENALGFDYRSILEYLFDAPIKSFQISVVTLEPGNTRPKVSTDAYEFIYLITGELKYHLNEQVLDIRTGDALFFDGNLPHVPMNVQDVAAQYLVIYFFLNQQAENAFDQ